MPKPRVLVSDPVAKEGVEILKKVADVDVKTGMPKEELIACIGDYDALAVRSETKVTADVLEAAKNLKIIGRAGVGVDNIDVPVATQKGILVVNSPEGNTLAAAELTVALLLSMSRNIAAADASMKAGQWNRKAFMGVEVYNKVIGVVGLGKIGREVAKRMQAFGMQVIAFDPFLSAESAKKLGIESVEINELLQKSDYITLHLPKTKDTEKMISKPQFEMMKDGVRIINVARGGIIDEQALADALTDGKVAGAAVDVFSQEPINPENPLITAPNIVITPHLGASTEEAQSKVAVDVAEQIVEVLSGRPAKAAVNMPSVSSEVLEAIQPFLTLAERMGTLLTSTSEGSLESVEVSYCGELAAQETGPITRAVLKGLLQPILSENVNYVNAPIIAEAREISVTESKSAGIGDYASLLSIDVKTDKGTREIAGTLFGTRDLRIVRLDGYPIDLIPEGNVLIAPHIDKPGIIGKVGTLLGNNRINIAGMHVGRKSAGQRAIMALSVDDVIPDNVMAELVKIDGIESARQVQF